MPGERVPDHSSPRDAGSSDDDISLREHMQRQLDTMFKALQSGLDTAKDAAERLDREQDRRYEQRFTAQEQAVQLALARVDKEFHEHIAQVRTETHAALEAADKAITKSEIANDKRFDAVNEFRAQLADQSRTFITRDESLSRHDRSGEAIAEMAKRHEMEIRVLRERVEADIKTLRDRHDADVSTINSRLDLGQGRSTGIDKAWGYLVAAIIAAGGIVGLIISTR